MIDHDRESRWELWWSTAVPARGALGMNAGTQQYRATYAGPVLLKKNYKVIEKIR